jgi:hypothetical protein
MDKLQWQIQVDEAALVYLAAYQNALMLRTSPRHGCCGGTVLVPVAEPGIPQTQTNWHRLKQGDLTIYLEDGLVIPPGTVLRIRVDKFLNWHRLWVEGLEASM